MHETPDASGETPGAGGEAGRVAAVAVLLAVTVVGLRTHGAFSHTPDAAAAGVSGAVLATALVACEGIALAAFVVLLLAARAHRRPRDDQEPERLFFPWWAKTAGVLLAFGLLVTPLVVLLSLKVRKRTPVPPLAHLTSPLSSSRSPGTAAPFSAWPLIAGMVIAIAVVLTLTWLTRYRRRPGGRGPQDRAAALAEGLAAGSAALQASYEPRAAIIACYAAMERGFAAAGSAPAAADTPTEVLARATTAGLVRSISAEVLTGLFRRARYSAEPMTPADSAAAAAVLIQLRADLTAPGAADAAGAGAGAADVAEVAGAGR